MMEGISLYPDQNDVKVYLQKVIKVFQKMEYDLGTYRIKDNSPEKFLKMLRRVCELLFSNLHKNLLVDKSSEYTSLIYYIDKYLKQYQNSVISFINSYFGEKSRLSVLQDQTIKMDQEQVQEMKSILNDSVLNESFTSKKSRTNIVLDTERDKVMMMSTDREQQLVQTDHKKNQTQMILEKQKQNMSVHVDRQNHSLERVGFGHLLSKTRISSPIKMKGRFDRRSQIAEKVSLKFIPNELEQKIIQSKAPEPIHHNGINSGLNELLDKIKKLETKVRLQDQQVQEMEISYQKLFQEKSLLAKNYENLRKMNEHLISHTSKQKTDQINVDKVSKGNLLKAIKKHNMQNKKSNNEFKNLLEHLSDVNNMEITNDDLNSIQRVFQENEKRAAQKVNYWGDMRKGLNEKLQRVSNISSSNVMNQLRMLLDDLNQQKDRLTENARRKRKNSNGSDEDVDDFGSEEESDSNNNQNRNAYVRKKDVGTEPDNEIFDLEQIEKDLLIFQRLNDQYQQEMMERTQQIKKLTSQIESLYKVMESDAEARKRDEIRLGELQFKNEKLQKQVDELTMKLSKLQNQYNMEVGIYKKQIDELLQNDKKVIDAYIHRNDDKKQLNGDQYEDPMKIKDVKKLQEMCAQLQFENLEMQQRIFELEGILRKHNIEVPQASASFVKATMGNKNRQKKMAESQQRQNNIDNESENNNSGWGRNNSNQHIWNKNSNNDQNMWNGNKQISNQMKEQRKNFHNMSAADQQKFLSKLSTEQQQEFLNSLSPEQKKQFIQQQMKNGNSEFMEQMMENFDNLDPSLQKQFLQNMSKEEQQKFFEKKKEMEEKKKEMEVIYEKFEEMSEQEKQKLLNSMSAEEREKFIEGQKKYQQKKQEEQYMEKMMDRYEKMSEKEKQEFINGLSEEQKQKFIEKKRARDEQKIEKLMEQQMANDEDAIRQGVEEALLEQIKKNMKSFKDKKLQTGDDNVESFDNEMINQYYQNQQIQQIKNTVKESEIKRKANKNKTNNNNSSSPKKKNKNNNGGVDGEEEQKVKEKKKRIKIVGPDGQVEYVTDNSEDEGKLKKKRKRINSKGEVEFVTDDEYDPKDAKNKKQKKVIGKNGEVFYVTDSEAEENMTLQQRQQKQAEKLKQQEEKRQKQLMMKKEKQDKERELQQISDHLLKQLDQKIRDRQNKGGYLDGEQFLNNAEMDYLYDMIKHEYGMKGEAMFDNKGDNIMQMFKQMFDLQKNGMPSPQQFKEFMERIQKMHMKCGHECRHLKRFLNRLGLIRKGWWTNRVPLKMSCSSVDPVKFPKIDRDKNIYQRPQQSSSLMK